MTHLRWAALILVVLALTFAIEGGEYGISDWLTLREQVQKERKTIDALESEVDSLEKAAIAIERDRRVQERVARESFGMIRKGEFLYKLVPEEQ